MRKHELLTEAEREQLLGIPTERDDLARLYTFEPSDVELIRLRREDRNRLGVALQLALFRHPGMTLAQILQSSAGLPEELVSFIAEQLKIPAIALADYAGREQTMTDHAREFAAAHGLCGAARTDIPFMIEAAAKAAWSTDKGIVIAAGIIDALRQAKILLPAASTIERAGIAGRARARKQAAHALLSGLRREQLDALDALLVPDASKGAMPLTWLKAIPATAKPDYVRDILNACEW
ncbi:uncharacterized protein DUF4158 [Ensifer adhaerens]|nr:uncharacterized protein DUF4158 [Ensifer adhaerens]